MKILVIKLIWYYYGFKLHLLIDSQGIPIHFDLAPANIADIDLAEELLTFNSHGKLALADKGYISQQMRKYLLNQHDIQLLTPTRKNQKVQLPKAETKLLNKIRQKIEIVNNVLKDQFHCEKTYAKTLLGLVAKINSKLAALTFGIFLNKLFGRKILNLVSLIA